MYSAQLLDHFQNPRGVGDLANASVSVELQNPACGDVLRLSLLVDQGRIVDARFRAKGCVPAIACGSKLVEAITGKQLSVACELKEETLVEALGGLPQASRHAAALAIDALRAALKQL
ncbi:MAG TPA: iron-sulfur cluster assembly scaffold protein [Terriglobales bacterium]|nr:iron-sulfur cluster assembly scaffold protein [Terriglobales bacterium]